MRGLLRVAETPYTWAVRWRNRRYDRGRARVHRLGVPVVSVGNLTLGGTGKTPMVAWLARWFRGRGVRVALISRGYGAEHGSRNDEALELDQRLPDVPHLQNSDRVAAATLAVEEFESQLILLDDGFQHRRLGRDLDLVMVDALEPFGLGHVFPRGTLREPLAGLARADCVALSRSDMVDGAQRDSIHREVERIAPRAAWIEVAHSPQVLRSAGGNEAEIHSLAGRKVAAFCGLGNPRGFQHTLASCGLHVEALREFADHHDYSRDDVDSLARWADGHRGVEAVLCTHKDLVKLGIERLGELRLWALVIGLEILHGREALEVLLAPLAGRVSTCGVSGPRSD